MVEGPGATRNGRKLQPLVGLVLNEISFQQPHMNGSASTNITNKRLQGRCLECAFSVGKEVFLVLGPTLCPIRHETEKENTISNATEQTGESSESTNKSTALRFHFGMNGCLTVRRFGESTRLAPWRKKDTSSKKYTLKFGKKGFVHDDGAHRNSRHHASSIFTIETAASTCTVVSAFVARSKLSRLRNKDVCAKHGNLTT